MSQKSYSIKYVAKFLDKIISKGVVIKNAILFGSYAENKANKDSDIDLLLVGDDFCGLGIIDYYLMIDELIEFDLLHLKTYPTRYFEEGDPLIDEIKRTGIEIKIK